MTRRCISWLTILFLFAGIIPTSAFASPLNDWNILSPSRTTNSLLGIAFGNGHYVAVGSNGSILTSSDGESWTDHTVGSNRMNGVIYSNGMFLAVGDDGKRDAVPVLLASSDGESWTSRSLPNNTFSLSGITYGNGKYVAVGSIGTILTSDDGEYWTSQTSGTTASLTGVCYGDGKYVAVGYSGTILTSIDGVNWTSQTLDYTYFFYAVIYMNGKYVAVGANGAYDCIFVSSDGAHWTNQPSGQMTILFGVTYGNGKYVAVGTNGTILTSGDGANWTSKTMGTGIRFNSVAYGNGKYVAVGTNGTISQYVYPVSYNSNGATSGDEPSDSSSYTQGDTVTILGNTGNLTKTGYMFAGWNTKADGSGTTYLPNGMFTMGESNVTLYAQWTFTASTYKVTYDGNGSDGGDVPIDGNAYEAGSALNIPGNPGGLTKTGYAFTGWNTKADGSGTTYLPDNVLTMGAGNATLYVKWKFVPPTYKLTYDGNGSDGGDVPIDGNAYEAGSMLNIPYNLYGLTKTGYAFDGWNTKADGSGTTYLPDNVLTMGAGNVTLYVKWKFVPPTYKLTYNGNGSDGGDVPIDANAYEAGSALNIPGNPGGLTKTGYVFTSWNAKADGSGTTYLPDNVLTMGAGNVTLYAQWTFTPSTYKVTYDGNGSDGGDVPIDANAYEAGSALNTPGNPGGLTKTGYVFTSWNTKADGSGTTYLPDNVLTMGAGNVTLYAQWTFTPSTYKLTYDGNGSDGGDVPIDANAYEAGSMLNIPYNLYGLTKTGYAFDGWNTKANGSGTKYVYGNVLTMGAGNVTLYAQWEINKYTLSYTAGANGTITGNVSQNVNRGSDGTTVTAVPNAGYHFVKWSDDIVTAERTDTNVTANVSVTAKFEINTYTVIFDKNYGDGDTTLTTKTAADGGNVGTLPPPPTRSGYTFTGWNTAASGTGRTFDAATTVSGDISVYAQWTANPTIPQTIPPTSTPTTTTLPTPENNNKITSQDGKATIPAGKAGEVSLGSAITISIPANTSEKELKLTIEQVLDTHNLVTEKEVLASPIYEILKNFKENFSSPVTLTFSFDPTILKSNQKAVVFYYDEAKKVWVEVPGGKINEDRISVDVEHFTKFAVFIVDHAAEIPAKDFSETISAIKFSDIAGHWAEANVKRAVSTEFVTGYPNGTFKPDKIVTRAEFVVMLMNALKLQGEPTTLTFADQSKIGSWAQRAVAQAVYAGVIKGYEDGSFRPESPITRAEMAAMLANVMGLTFDANAETSFEDDKDIPGWAKTAVAAMKKLGIVAGKGSNKFHPDDQTTRAEAVTVLLHMLDINKK